MMKRIVPAVLSAMMILFAGSAMAQDEQPGPPGSRPIEAYSCNFNDGMGPADLAEVVEDWNEWMDERGYTRYFAATMSPHYFGQRNFDVAWLGMWPDGNAMGAGTDDWLVNGQEIGAKLFEVLDCTSHINFALMEVKASPIPYLARGDMFVLEFSNCSILEGKSYDDYLAAQREWNTYADEHGIAGGSWNLWPVWGETADAGYDFKRAYVLPDYATLGANWALSAAGHGQKAMELFGELAECDSPRIYTATVQRVMEGGG